MGRGTGTYLGGDALPTSFALLRLVVAPFPEAALGLAAVSTAAGLTKVEEEPEFVEEEEPSPRRSRGFLASQATEALLAAAAEAAPAMCYWFCFVGVYYTHETKRKTHEH